MGAEAQAHRNRLLEAQQEAEREAKQEAAAEAARLAAADRAREVAARETVRAVALSKAREEAVAAAAAAASAVEVAAAATAAVAVAAEAAAKAKAKADALERETADGGEGGSSEAVGPLEASEAAQVPDDYMCPITAEIMTDPVSTLDGFTYERTAILDWLRTNDTSPLTGTKLESTTVIPNLSLRSMIRAFTEALAVVTAPPPPRSVLLS